MATPGITPNAARLLPLKASTSKALRPAQSAASADLKPAERQSDAPSFVQLDGRQVPGGLQSLQPAAAGSRREAQEAVKAFEAVFLRTLASAMTASASQGGGTGKMQGGEFYQGLIDEQFGRLLAEDGGMGKGLEQALLRVMLPTEGVDADVER
ncbi:MAG: hypothetical protein R3C71_01790 [Candidatus Krumholzibacteriia bacterium]|nr:hypothetical protein [bacterium]MCB9515224.1 hypothetical protein [Candidatus Latescibacterota bacterium]